ncbi:hypothetical protein TNCV_4193341 [Trichonephila clavipes]|nr:hypothetical protein TNCV_4193341 [Trichonephila clavipes]
MAYYEQVQYKQEKTAETEFIIRAYIEPPSKAGRRTVLLARWIVRSVPLEIVGSSGQEGTHEVPTHGKPGLEGPGRSRGELIEVWCASTCGPHSDSFNDTSRPEHRQLRLQWCQIRSMWNVTDWQKVVFTDESHFVLGTGDNRVRVWMCPGERYNPPTPLSYVKLPAQLV